MAVVMTIAKAAKTSCKDPKSHAWYNNCSEDFDHNCCPNFAIHTQLFCNYVIVWVIVTTIVRILQLFRKVATWNRAGI